MKTTSAMRSRLNEAIDVARVVITPGTELEFESMLASWSRVPAPELSVVLAALQFVYRVHQTNHWSAAGTTFYSDHGLFERLYSSVADQIDAVAERAVGAGGAESVELSQLTSQLDRLVAGGRALQATVPGTSGLAQRSLAAEFFLLRTLQHAAESMRDSGTLTRGIDNLLAGIEDEHEKNVYLLKRRITQNDPSLGGLGESRTRRKNIGESDMRITLGEMRRVIRDVIAEAAGSGFYLTGPDGKSYVGSRDAVRRAMVQNSRADAAERDEVMSSGRASAAIISALKRAGVIERHVSAADKASKDDRERERSQKRSDAGLRRDNTSRDKLERAYRKAVDEFASKWTDFTEESPDISPDDAAPDVADGFFHDYPEWPEWARALHIDRQGMKEAVADHVYNAMTKKGGRRP